MIMDDTKDRLEKDMIAAASALVDALDEADENLEVNSPDVELAENILRDIVKRYRHFCD